jgi:hypothetical protein
MTAAHPLAVAAAVRDRPDPRNTCIPVYIGNLALTAECTVTGRFRPAVTQADPLECYPAESPEVEIVRLWLSGPWRDVSGLLDDARIAEDLLERCEEYVADHANDGPDPDDAYDRWRDRQTEGR